MHHFNAHPSMTIAVMQHKSILRILLSVLKHVAIIYLIMIVDYMHQVVRVPKGKFFSIPHRNVFRSINVHVNTIVNFIPRMQPSFRIIMDVRIVLVKKVVFGHVRKLLAVKHVRSLVMHIIKLSMDYIIIFLVNVNIF